MADTIDLPKLSDATADMMEFLGGDEAAGDAAQAKLEAEGEVQITTEERVLRDVRQQEHLAKLKQQRAADTIDLAKLSDATADMMEFLGGDEAAGDAAQAKLEAEGEVQITAEERALRDVRQREHLTKLKQQRAEAQAKEAAAEAKRKEAAKTRAAGTMGIGRVPVDAGGACPAYEFELGYASLEVFVPLPANVTKANQLVVEVGVRTLRVGMRGAEQPYLRGTFPAPVREDETVWTLENGEIHIELTKANAGEHWPGALVIPDAWECKWE